MATLGFFLSIAWPSVSLWRRKSYNILSRLWSVLLKKEIREMMKTCSTYKTPLVGVFWSMKAIDRKEKEGIESLDCFFVSGQQSSWQLDWKALLPDMYVRKTFGKMLIPAPSLHSYSGDMCVYVRKRQRKRDYFLFLVGANVTAEWQRLHKKVLS